MPSLRHILSVAGRSAGALVLSLSELCICDADDSGSGVIVERRKLDTIPQGVKAVDTATELVD